MMTFQGETVAVKFRPTLRPQAPPAEAKTTELSVGHKKRPGCRAFTTPTIFESDQVLVLRDGTKLRADIFRPKTDEKVPGIVMWGPYGKTNSGMLTLDVMPFRAGVPESSQSGYESFEGLDPAEWVPRGYSIINIDARGAGDSEGDISWWGSSDGRDGHDAIEELAKLPWSNGKLGMAGNSWLAIAQYFIAAEQPPHLAAIAPLEGATDSFREESFRGGIPNVAFSKSIADILPGRNQQEDWPAMIESTSTTNDYFEDKRADLSKIKVPAYIGGSYSSDIHTLGSLRAFEEIPHEDKWLVVHSTQEWYDLYTSSRTADLDKYFSRYLKDAQNDWEATPPVRLSLLNYTCPAIDNIPFPDLPWHLPSAECTTVYLAPDLTLSPTAPSDRSTLTYQADSSETLSFTHTFAYRTALVGPSTLTVNISSPDHDDLDIYTHIFKHSASGLELSNLNIPISSTVSVEEARVGTQNRVFRYWGPSGQIRASQRHISLTRSTKTWSTLSHEKVQKVTPGEVVRLDVQLWPTGIIFAPGEKLVLTISGEKIGIAPLPNLPKGQNQNRGQHVLYLSGDRESSLKFFTVNA